METGRFETVLQLAPMSNVCTMKKRGVRTTMVQGAIVKSSCNNFIVYEESRFQIRQACWAKWEDDVQSKHYPATKLTGYICFSDGKKSGYTYRLFDDDNKSKSKKENEKYKWRCSKQIKDAHKRSRAKNARRISPPERERKEGRKRRITLLSRKQNILTEDVYPKNTHQGTGK